MANDNTVEETTVAISAAATFDMDECVSRLTEVFADFLPGSSLPLEDTYGVELMAIKGLCGGGAGEDKLAFLKCVLSALVAASADNLDRLNELLRNFGPFIINKIIKPVTLKRKTMRGLVNNMRRVRLEYKDALLRALNYD
ncbi:hypothetical protein CCFV1_ORF040 [Cotesia congregata filamentous virus 1]|uniref:MMS19 nucleotide excision repair protein n=1 Tax=Cotesia congregata filamentous virus 1 TaxID=3064291 RepID=A0ABC8QK46_9VIRU|nr:hypothetical protein CCFV1_ORF040 [Cotesia congregata filamentous virus 1]